MDSFEANKILGAVLGTLTLTLALSIGSEILFTPHAPEKAGYELAEPAEDSAGGGAPAQEEVVPIANVLATADASRGEDIVKRCLSCHSFEKGGPNKAGPNLYGIVGSHKAHLEGFGGYSSAMQAAEGSWGFEELNAFLTKPSAYIPGTTMNFLGLARPQQRADVILYLNQNSDSPLPLPEPVAEGAAAPAGDEAPAEGAPATEQAPPATEQAPAETPAGPAAPAGTELPPAQPETAPPPAN